jgi:glycosyltransferase involved in cell wall biosynthesis
MPAEPLRILIVIDNFAPLVGGAEQSALESGRALAARGHRVDVLTMRKKADWPAQEQMGSLRVFRFHERRPPRPFGRLLYERLNAAAARRFVDGPLAGNGYNLLLLHPIDAAFGASRSRVAGQATVVTCFHAPLGQEHRLQVHGLLETEKRLLPRIAARLSAGWTARWRAAQQRAAIHRSDGVTCPSQYSRELLGETAPDLGGKPVRVIPWGVDAKRFRPAGDRRAVRAALGWRPEELVLFTARRLVPRMGLAQLIRGVGFASRSRPALRLVIAGQGPMRDQLEELARRAAGRVDFAGFVPDEDLPRYYQAADLFVLPSLALEAFGLTILEALACGTPVLATNRCAAPEILAPLDPRLLLPSDDPAAIAKHLLEAGATLADEPGLRERCRAYAVERYPWDRTAAAFEEFALQLQATKVAGASEGGRGT